MCVSSNTYTNLNTAIDIWMKGPPVIIWALKSVGTVTGNRTVEEKLEGFVGKTVVWLAIVQWS